MMSQKPHPENTVYIVCKDLSKRDEFRKSGSASMCFTILVGNRLFRQILRSLLGLVVIERFWFLSAKDRHPFRGRFLSLEAGDSLRIQVFQIRPFQKRENCKNA